MLVEQAGRQAAIDVLDERRPAERFLPQYTHRDGQVHDRRSTIISWQAALVPVDWCKVAPELHSMKQSVSTFATSSCSSAATIDEAACTSSQPANSHNRGGRHDRARPPTLPIAKKRTVWPTVNACHLAVWWSAVVRRRPKQAMEGQMEAQSQ